MAKQGKGGISWCDFTFNGWIGCTKVGPGCDHCYAEARDIRFTGGKHWGSGAPRRRTSNQNWKQPFKWNREAEDLGIRYRVFCASLADVFDNEVDPEWRADLFRVIHQTQNLDWLLLTKRIGNAEQMIERARIDGHLLTSGSLPWPWPNVWLGATVVNQEEANRDIPKLLETPATVHFLSMEPLLEEVNLNRIYLPPNSGRFWINALVDWYPTPERPSKIDWVIAGGESGPYARSMQPNWVRNIRDQCKEAGVPFLFKQWGEWAPVDILASESAESLEIEDKYHFVDDEHIVRLGKKKAGRELDGITYTEFPSR